MSSPHQPTGHLTTSFGTSPKSLYLHSRQSPESQRTLLSSDQGDLDNNDRQTLDHDRRLLSGQQLDSSSITSGYGSFVPGDKRHSRENLNAWKEDETGDEVLVDQRWDEHEPGESSGLLARDIMFRQDLPDAARNSIAELIAEMRILSKLARPVVVAFLLQKAIEVTSVLALGHLGAQELAASALGSMFCAVTGWSLAFGMATALDTLGSQAYTASSDPHALGVYLQRAIIIIMLMSFPITIIWWYSEQLLLFLGQEPELAALSGLFIRWTILSILPYILFECLKRYLQAQGIMHASTYVLMVSCPINIATNYALVWWPPVSLGFIGAPIATAITYWLAFVLLFLYICFIEGNECWGGWSRKAITDLSQFTRLGLAGVVMVCSEWWAFEVVALAASYLGTVALAAQSIILTTAAFFYMTSAGISIASANRIGNLLGARQANRARLAAHGSLYLGMIVATFNSAILIIFKDRWGYIFNNDPEVIALAGSVLPIAALFQLGDVLGSVGGGILRGLGQQRIGAILSFFAYYIVALPIALWLAFNVGLGLAGLWWGLCAALSVVSSGEVLFISQTNWPQEVEKCQRRVYHETRQLVRNEEETYQT